MILGKAANLSSGIEKVPQAVGRLFSITLSKDTVGREKKATRDGFALKINPKDITTRG